MECIISKYMPQRSDTFDDMRWEKVIPCINILRWYFFKNIINYKPTVWHLFDNQRILGIILTICVCLCLYVRNISNNLLKKFRLIDFCFFVFLLPMPDTRDFGYISSNKKNFHDKKKTFQKKTNPIPRRLQETT